MARKKKLPIDKSTGALVLAHPNHKPAVAPPLSKTELIDAMARRKLQQLRAERVQQQQDHKQAQANSVAAAEQWCKEHGVSYYHHNVYSDGAFHMTVVCRDPKLVLCGKEELKHPNRGTMGDDDECYLPSLRAQIKGRMGSARVDQLMKDTRFVSQLDTALAALNGQTTTNA